MDQRYFVRRHQVLLAIRRRRTLVHARRFRGRCCFVLIVPPDRVGLCDLCRGGRKITLAYRATARCPARGGAAHPVPPFAPSEVVVNAGERVPSPIGRGGPLAAVIVAELGHDDAILVAEGDGLAPVVESSGVGAEDARLCWDRVGGAQGGSIDVGDEDALELLQDVRLGVGFVEIRKRVVDAIREVPFADVEWRTGVVVDLDELRLTGRRIVVHLGEDHLLGVGGRREGDEGCDASAGGHERDRPSGRLSKGS